MTLFVRHVHAFTYRYLFPILSRSQRSFHIMLPLHQPTTHLDRTSTAPRSTAIYPAEIIRIKEETPTVKSFLFQIPPTPTSLPPETFRFLPGQWLDVFIPNITTVGGFSITSSPTHYTSTHQFELAIKRSDHSPAQWFSDKAEIGDNVDIRIGGGFVMDIESLKGKEIIFIAGGVGINPIMSMLSSIAEHRLTMAFQKVTLLYSASSMPELLFRTRIESLVSSHHDLFHTRYFVTKQSHTDSDSVKHRRIKKEDIRSLLNPTNLHDRPVCFVCGPPPMTDAVIRWLKELGWDEGKMRFERWW